MKVCYFYRPKNVSYSIERVFAGVRRAMPADIAQSEFYCPFASHKNPLTYWRNVRAASRCAADVNHITGAVHYLAFGLPAARTVITVHDIASGYSQKGVKAGLIREIFFKKPLRRVAAVVAISEFTRDQLIARVGIPASKITVIHDPAPEDFSFVPKDFDTQKPRILCFAHLPNKNLRRHVQALEGVRCHLRVIGACREDIAFLERSGIEYSAVSGLSDEAVRAEYAQADLLLFASTYEGFGVPVLEAQLTGRPVVTSHVTSLAEVARDSAEIVDPVDPVSIRKGVQAVIGSASLRKELCDRGFENVKRFAPGIVAAEYAALYARLK